MATVTVNGKKYEGIDTAYFGGKVILNGEHVGSYNGNPSGISIKIEGTLKECTFPTELGIVYGAGIKNSGDRML